MTGPMVIRRYSNAELLAMARDKQITGEELAKLWDHTKGNWQRLIADGEFGSVEETPDEFFRRTGARL